MVEYKLDIDRIFYSLADPTRRDILKRVAKKELSVNELAERYDLTLAAVSKHIQVLAKAHLIEKRREGTHQYIALSPPAMKFAYEYIEEYRKIWEEKFERLDEVLEKLKKKHYG
ncbi:MAG: metalloregulator ArsR/SmtB family transcription factor [Patescibacteria group bacterium]